MAIIELPAVEPVQTLHPGTEVRLGRLDEQMDVVVHQAVREAVPLRPRDGEAKRGQVQPPIIVVAIDQAFGVAASEDVMDPVRDLLPWFACHTPFRHAAENLAPFRGVRPP